MIKSLIVFFLVIWINLEVFGQDSGKPNQDSGLSQDEQIKQAEKDLDKAWGKWRAVQNERANYIDVTRDVGTRWANTTWEMYRITRRKEMREKELDAIEDKVYQEWVHTRKFYQNRSKEEWRESFGRELIRQHDEIRSKLNSEYIDAINKLNEKGLKGNDDIEKNLDQRQAEVLAEYRQATERLNILRGLTYVPPKAEPTELEKNLSKMQDLLDSVKTQVKGIDSILSAAGETVAGPKEISPETQVQGARTAAREIANSQAYAIEKVREARLELERLQNRMGQLIDEYARGQRSHGWSASWDDINSNIRYWQRVINSYLRDATGGAVQPQSGSSTGSVSSSHEHDEFGRDTGAGKGNLGPTEDYNIKEIRTKEMDIGG